MGGRRRWTIVLAAAALTLGVGGAAAADDAAVTTVLTDRVPIGLFAGPDAAIWGTWSDATGEQVVRLDSASMLTPTRIAAPAGRRTWPWQPFALPDGTIGDFMRSWGSASDPPALVRFAPGAGTARVTQLPLVAAGAYGTAVAPDGAIWFARSCADSLVRVAPASGRPTLVRLPHLGCGDRASDLESGAALAFDQDGSLWLVNACIGRVDRVSLDGRVREWRTPQIDCDAFWGVTNELAVDPRGGIVWKSSSYSGGPVAGRVRRGRLESMTADGGAFTADGALWQAAGGTVERMSPGGSLVRVAGADAVSRLVPLRRDGVAFVKARFWRSYGGDSHNPPTPAYLDPAVVVLRADGTRTSFALPDGGTDAPWQLSAAELVLGPDGAFYVRERLVGTDGYAFSSRLLRVLPAAADPPRAALARTVRVLARVRRTVWLQLACNAAPGRWCVGTATLGGAHVAHPARFAIAGNARGAVPVVLDRRGVRTLRRHGELRAPAIVSCDGTLTRRGVRIRR